MKRIILLLLLMCQLVMSFAARWTPETLPVPPNATIAAKANYVSNPDAVLSDSAVRRINYVMYNLEKMRGVRGLIIAVEAIEPEDPYTFAMAVANKHGVGGKANTGFVLMMATQSQAYSLLSGSGLEKFLTDAQCSQLVRTYMVPFMRQHRWDPAVEMVVYRIRDVLQDQEELVPDDSKSSQSMHSDEEKSMVSIVVEWLTIGAIILIGLLYLITLIMGLFYDGDDTEGGHHSRFFSGSGRSRSGGHPWGSRGGGSFSGGGASGHA